MKKKAVTLSLETIVVFIIILVALTVILLFLLSNYTSLLDSFKQNVNATTSLAKGVTLPKP